MPDQLLRSAYIAAEGPLVLNGETLIGIIVKDTYVFSTAHENASEVTAYEVEPVSTESRLTGTCAVVLNDAETAWLPLVTGTTAVDLSDVEDRGGIVWVRPGASDAVRKIIGWAADPGPDDAAYLPTWPDGLYAELIAPISGSDPLALGDLSDTDTDGVNAGDSLVFDGATWVPAASSSEPAARRLGAAWCIDARSAVGTSVWADQGRAGVDMVNTGRGAAVVQPGAFTGLRPYGPFFSEVGATWPVLLDVRWKGKVRRQRRDPLNDWIEALLVTIDGDEDWLEPAYVNGPDGWFLGLDLRLDGEDSEREFLGTTPIDPDQDWCWRFVMDGTDVVLYRKAFSADLLVHTGWTELERAAVSGLPMLDPGSETAGPYTLAAPPEGTLLGVSFTGALVAEAVLLDGIDGDPLHHFRASDGAEGATTVTTSGETWTATVGLLSVAPDNPTMTSSDTGWGAVDPATFDIDSDQSVSWAWRGRPWPVGGSGSTLVVGDNALAMFTGGAAGWGFASAPGSGVDWAFLISDGSGMVTADAGAAPTGYVTVAAVLDRSDDTVRLYIDTVLVATADGSSLGAIASTGVEQGYSDLEWVAMWPRALDVDELAYLQGSI